MPVVMPEKDIVKKDIVIKLLLKAMMNLPESNFTSLVYLIPMTISPHGPQLSNEKNQKQDQKEIAIILNLGQYLEDCKFDLFWKEFNLNKKLFEDFKSFEFCI